MKKYLLAAVISGVASIFLSGCGGGGGGSSTPAPAAKSKAVTKAYLFGAMSSSSIIATVQTSMVVPSGVLVNYTSASGATSGVFPLKSGVLVPSGTVKVAANDLSGTFDTASRKLAITMVNATTRASLQSSATGSGTEFATINFTLATPGTTPALPTSDPTAVISQDRQSSGAPSVGYLSGCILNFTTTFQ
jgi:hypothetical protein